MARTFVLHTRARLHDDRPHARELRPDAYGRDLLAELPILARAADVSTRILFDLDSGDMQPSHWVAIAHAVHAALADEGFDGVVVVHGTDTMAYTASALALMLGPLPRPVLLTGAQRPLVEVRTDARQNLVDAVYAATLPVPEVGVAFAFARAARRARAMKRDAWALAAFDLARLPAARGPAWGGRRRRLPRLAPAPCSRRLTHASSRACWPCASFLGLDPALVEGALRVGVKGLVLEAYGTGNLPSLDGSLIPPIERARAMGVPVLVVSQCPRGFVDMGRYHGGAAAVAAGAIPGGEMTVEAALAKLMIGLGRYSASPAELRAWLEREVVGEAAALASGG